MRGKLPEEMVPQQNLGPIRVAGEGARCEGKMRHPKKGVSGGACVILCGGCTGGDASVGVRLWEGWEAGVPS